MASRDEHSRGEVLWEPPADAWTTTAAGRFATAHGHASYADLHAWSVGDLDGFWSAVSTDLGVHWHDAPTTTLADAAMPGARWFPGGTLSYAEHALAAAADRPDDVAVVARSQTRGPSELTWGQLAEQVARAAAGLRRLGVERGDRVVAYAPNIPETLVAFLATASIGAIWSSCAPEFGTRSVIDRFSQVEPTVLVAVDGYRYGTKAIDRTAELATVEAALPTLRHTVRIPYLDPAGEDGWSDLLAGPDPGPPTFVPVSFDHPLYVLFSSGTTGLPKAIVLFDGDPAHPSLSTLWDVAEETGTTIFGASAPFLMACRKEGLTPARGALRWVGSTGAPLPADGFRWVDQAVGVPVSSISGGTDVCTAFLGTSPLLPVRAGEISARMLGCAVEAFRPDGTSCAPGELGELVITAPMPSMPVGFWGDDDGSRYRAAYFEDYPGVWRHGDWVTFTEDGAATITGRSDATLNRGGVRLGTSDFYAVVEALPEVADSLVVHLEDDAGGAGELILFVALAPGVDEPPDLAARIAGALRSELSPRHVPDRLEVVPAVPRTLSGKKLEVPVKRILTGTPVDDAVSRDSLSDPTSLDAFIALADPG